MENTIAFAALMLFVFGLGWGAVDMYRYSRRNYGPRTKIVALIVWLMMSLMASISISLVPLQLSGGYVYGPLMLHPAIWNVVLNWLLGLVFFGAGALAAKLIMKPD